jgi:alpha-galactosidase
MDWLADNGELARHSYDVSVWGEKDPWTSIMLNYDQQIRLARYQSPGFFNDPDFLISDRPELPLDEKRSHFALWASFSAPLLISAHIPDLGKDELAFLTNKNLIDVDQDALSQRATLASRDSTWDVLTKSLANGDRLLTVLNRSPAAASTTIPLEQLGLLPTCNYAVRDLWTGDGSGSVSGEFKVKNVPAHGPSSIASLRRRTVAKLSHRLEPS